MSEAKSITSRRCVAWLVYVGLALRVVMPAGYMPAPLADGLPFVLCPDGIFGLTSFGISNQSPVHDQHSEHDGAVSDHGSSVNGETCPFGSAFGATAPLAEFAQHSFLIEQILAREVTAGFVPSSIPRPFRARAPPKPAIQA